MTYKQFLKALRATKSKFNWVLLKQERGLKWEIRAMKNRRWYCPLTAVCRVETGRVYLVMQDASARWDLDLTSATANQITREADDRSHQRTKTRRDLLQAVGLKEKPRREA